MSAANQGFGSIRHLAVRFFVSLRPGGPPPADEAWAEDQLLPGERALWVRLSGPDRRHAIGVARDTIADLAAGGPGVRTLGGEAAAVDPGVRGPVDPGVRGPVDPGVRGPVDPGVRGPVDPGVRSLAEAGVPRPVVAAALLHDVGKLDSGLGTWARAGVTIVSMVAGRDRVAAWAPPPSEAGAPSPPSLSAPGGRGAGSRDRPPRGLRVAAGRYVTHDRLGAALLQAAGSDPLTVAWAGEHHLPEAAWTVDRRIADALKAADGD